MAKADAVEVNFDGGERSATRGPTLRSREHGPVRSALTLNVRHGTKQGSASTREFDEESLKAMVDEAQEAAQKGARQPQPAAARERTAGIRQVDAVLPKTADFARVNAPRG